MKGKEELQADSYGLCTSCDAIMVIDCSKGLNGMKPGCVQIRSMGLNDVSLHDKLAGSRWKITNSPTNVIDSPVPSAEPHIMANDPCFGKTKFKSGSPVSDPVEVDSRIDVIVPVTDSSTQMRHVLKKKLTSDTSDSNASQNSNDRVEVDGGCSADGVSQKLDVISSLLSQTSIADPVASELDQEMKFQKRAPIGSYPTQQRPIPRTPSFVWNDAQLVNAPAQVDCQIQGRQIEDSDPRPVKYMKTGCPEILQTPVGSAELRTSIIGQPAVSTASVQLDLTDNYHTAGNCSNVPVNTCFDSCPDSQGLNDSDVHKEYCRLKYILDGTLPDDSVNLTTGSEGFQGNHLNAPTVNTDQCLPGVDLLSGFPAQADYSTETFFKDFFDFIADELAKVQTPEATTIQEKTTMNRDEETRALSWASKLSRDELWQDDSDGDNLLHSVVIVQDFFLLKALLARLEREGLLKQLINKPNRDKQTPLYLAVALKLDEGTHGVQEDIIMELLQCGAEVNAWSCHSNKDHSKEVIYQTPLHLAASLGQDNILEMLLRSKADGINQANSILETPVHCAIKKHGCLQKNKQRRDCRGVLKILKCYNANFSAKTKMNKTILHMVADKGDHTLMAFLLELLTPAELSAIINEQDDNGNTVLHIASGLEAQPTVERVIAAEYMIRQLLAKGADEQIKNRENKIAYDFVPRSYQCNGICVLLMKRQKSTKKLQRMTEYSKSSEVILTYYR